MSTGASLTDRFATTLDNLGRGMYRAIGDFAARLTGRPPAAGTDWSWPGIYLGRGHGGAVWSGPEHHVLVIGPPRSGKTTSIVIPTVAFHHGPVVVTSTKSDVLQATVARRLELGRCWLWDPTGTAVLPVGVEQLRWSPVQGCEHWDSAVERAWVLATAARPGQHLTDAAHWVERAQALLAPLLHAAALSDGDLACVLSWLHRREVEHPQDILRHHRAHLAQDLLYGIAATDHRERSGIFSTADSILAAYRSQTALAATRCPNFNVEEFVSSADTLYVCAPSSAQARHAALVVTLLDHVRRSIDHRPRPWPPVIWALDEVANIAPLPDLPAVIADSAAQGLLVLACLQDLSQARSRWGGLADGFLTLFPVKVILPGVADLATLNVVSAVAGEVTLKRTTVNKPTLWIPGQGRATKTVGLDTQPRLRAHDISRPPVGHALLLTGTRPSWIRLTAWL